MSTVVKTRIIKIGNSHGIRIPKLMLDQLGGGAEVELALRQHQMIIRPVQHPRHDWDEQFRTMSERRDDRLLDETALRLTQWDADDWEWA